MAWRTFSLVPLLLAGLLSACASSRSVTGPNVAATSRHPGITCAPFARALSGIEIYGDAADWWDAAAGRYERSSQPEIGAVLILRRSSRLNAGHAAVVSRVLGPRQVHVIQANWVPDELAEDQLAIDVSPRNDWSAVRMWWPPTNTLGIRVYPAYGFILPPGPTTHDALRRNARPAARLALQARYLRTPSRARSYGG
ncbi:CHAP domain-containing protein [Rhodovastum atsumiense]|uniref:CHAP domain-containing protein n=1 Tax=Rhodovastum atsumiense TaxID=504468 RepID=UPI00139F29DF|nr:CHAP domain-containing protein [Rhodovastum atsumiense]